MFKQSEHWLPIHHHRHCVNKLTNISDNPKEGKEIKFSKLRLHLCKLHHYVFLYATLKVTDQPYFWFNNVLWVCMQGKQLLFPHGGISEGVTEVLSRSLANLLQKRALSQRVTLI